MKETAAHLFGSPRRCRSPSAFPCAFVAWPGEMAGTSSYVDTYDTTDEDDVVDQDPSGRYVRYKELLGRGATKKVYKGFDLQQGIEVAWNLVELPTDTDCHIKDRLFQEIDWLKKLKHKRIITLYDSWYDAKHHSLNFITEFFPSGTLRAYRKRFHKVISVSIIKQWAWQILEGLVYLHGQDVPIIHRDIKADNIFMNGRLGQVKIGDLGLATAQQGLSMVGTLGFMAPEVYEEDPDQKYNEKVDIYSFGMCLLELATLESPYCECRTPPQLYGKVSKGIQPDSLSKVSDKKLREFIELCISFEPKFRPSADELLQLPFFDDVRPVQNVADRPSPGSPGSSNGSPRSTGSATDVPPAFNNLYSSTPQQYASTPDYTISVDLSRSMQIKFGDTPPPMECGSSSDDEVLVPADVLKEPTSPQRVRSHSEPIAVGNKRDSPRTQLAKLPHDDSATVPIHIPTQHVVVRRKLLGESSSASSTGKKGLLHNSL